jgi:hypothetical protein
MNEYFSSDGTNNHLVDGPWAVTAFCGTAAIGDPEPQENPQNLCWTCAFEWADREIAALVCISDDALMTVALIDQLLADGQPELAATVLRDTASSPELFAEMIALRSQETMVVAA